MDLGARTAAQPAELPIGVLTAFVGAPFFLFLLRRRDHSHLMTISVAPLALSLSDVSVALGGRSVVDRVNLRVKAGSWLTIVGPNGAGKTSLLRAAAGLVKSTGRIAVDGVPLGESDHRTMARRIALMPQNPVVPPAMTVTDYVLLGRTPYLGRRLALGAEDLAVAAEVMQRLDLLRFGSRHVSELSGGELQRVVIARALTQQPDILLLDEPTTGLDLGHQQEVLELVDSLRTTELTVLATLHDLALAAQYSTEVALMIDGQITAVGAPAEVLTKETVRSVYGASVRVIETEDGLVVMPQRPDKS